MANIPLEIERKYLIRMPDTALLAAQDGARVKEITQTYLSDRPGVSARVREVVEGRETRYIYTAKRRLSTLTAEEDEREISRAEYEAYLQSADPARRPIRKTRYAIPYAGHVVEVDIYEFWKDRATAEIELSREDEEAPLPPYLSLVREVSADRRYKNAALAREVVNEEI